MRRAFSTLLSTMKGTLLLLALLVTGELGFQTSESVTLAYPISVPCRSLSGGPETDLGVPGRPLARNCRRGLMLSVLGYNIGVGEMGRQRCAGDESHDEGPL